MLEKAYIRNQEAVSAVQFDGAMESMRELMDSYPDTFEIRKPCAGKGKERGKPSLIVKSGRNYAAVKKDDYIVFDSFGNAQVYRPEYFSALFRRADAPVPSYVLADAIFELSKGISSEKLGEGRETLEYDELLEEEKEVYEKLASGLLRKFVIVPADEDLF